MQSQNFVSQSTNKTEHKTDYSGQQISKTFCICNEYVINLFICICEVRKGT